MTPLLAGVGAVVLLGRAGWTVLRRTQRRLIATIPAEFDTDI